MRSTRLRAASPFPRPRLAAATLAVLLLGGLAGVAFSKRSQGEPAGAELDDLVDGVDHLVASGLADRERVGITGGSYGGYATAWGATYYSERFAAGSTTISRAPAASRRPPRSTTRSPLMPIDAR